MRILDRVLLGLLIVDGLIVGLLSVAFVYLRIDTQTEVSCSSRHELKRAGSTGYVIS